MILQIITRKPMKERKGKFDILVEFSMNSALSMNFAPKKDSGTCA